MLKAIVTIQNNQVSAKVSHNGIEELVRELTAILDRAIADDVIKIWPSRMELSEAEKCELVKCERAKLCDLMKKEPFIQENYLNTKEMSDELYQRWPWLNDCADDLQDDKKIPDFEEFWRTHVWLLQHEVSVDLKITGYTLVTGSFEKEYMHLSWNMESFPFRLDNRVLVEDTEASVAELKRLGCTDREIRAMKDDETGTLNIYDGLRKKGIKIDVFPTGIKFIRTGEGA